MPVLTSLSDDQKLGLWNSIMPSSHLYSNLISFSGVSYRDMIPHQKCHNHSDLKDKELWIKSKIFESDNCINKTELGEIDNCRPNVNELDKTAADLFLRHARMLASTAADGYRYHLLQSENMLRHQLIQAEHVRHEQQLILAEHVRHEQQLIQAEHVRYEQQLIQAEHVRHEQQLIQAEHVRHEQQLIQAERVRYEQQLLQDETIHRLQVLQAQSAHHQLIQAENSAAVQHYLMHSLSPFRSHQQQPQLLSYPCERRLELDINQSTFQKNDTAGIKTSPQYMPNDSTWNWPPLKHLDDEISSVHLSAGHRSSENGDKISSPPGNFI